jgi:hypothetical protein
MKIVMQVSRRQAAVALEAVRRRHRRAMGRGRHEVRRGPATRPSPVVIDLVLREVEGQGPVRIKLVEEASARRAAGQWPTADEVADMALRRAVCDRLR